VLKGSETCGNENFGGKIASWIENSASTCVYLFESSVVDIVNGDIYLLYKLPKNYWESIEVWGIEKALMYLN